MRRMWGELVERLGLRNAQEPPGELQRELERLGVAPEVSGPVSERVARIAADLDADAYESLLEAVAVTCSVQNEVADDGRSGEVEERPHDLAGRPHDLTGRTRDLEEMSRLLLNFADELRKLEEGLKVLDAFLARIRARQVGVLSTTLH